METSLHMKDSRRSFLRTVGAAGVAAAATFPARAIFGQGRCGDGYGTAACPLSAAVATAPIKPVFAPTGWKTVALDQITFETPDYEREGAFFEALLGWKVRSDNGKRAVLDIGDWGSAIFKQAAERRETTATSFCFVIEPWNASAVSSELEKRGLHGVAENDGEFESFHVKDPDGFDLQISNGNGLARARKRAAAGKLSVAAPFAATGWKTTWLDHISFKVTNYKESVSFYANLLGWKGTYDEGSQQELLIGEVGDIIIRGGNPKDPNFGKRAAQGRKAEIDHISFGISPWDSDGVRAALEKRGLEARVDTASHQDIHVSAYKSYHFTTPNGYDIQISAIERDTRLLLSNVVRPKTS
jgi:catechol 2,3-dioxygenase-like lactoylglutathione lyase family enzyme